ncbi:5-formyltetrahydrofolate cyclo-ligase [Corynebacterium sp.]|uniref:5-formyltetrahydrofolate cyclo-ligase n=1 Tax=Corynebacterium sp. TaxID=1720 RepID=UPI002A909711|nr:5-formyltetrahydrofolate cyclo-ligase [Corynebacterium sp.]MDY5784504.1 5-formyltetrahydrofolate cyclo-ligase [Corynebacterium sp.]
MATKQQVRAERIAYRRHLRTTAPHKRALDDAIVRNILSFLDKSGYHGNIAAYSPLPSEPGGPHLLDALAASCRTLFLPISQPGGVLAWAVHSPDSVPGALGVSEPTGARFASGVLNSCDVVLAPALAVDRRGMRLGKGAGYYDRALSGVSTPVYAVVYDDEVLDAVPHDPHDVPVRGVITPSGNLRLG